MAFLIFIANQSSNMKQILSKYDESFCNIVGAFGIALSAICLIQCAILFDGSWLTFTIACVFIYNIVSYVFLVLKRAYAPLCIMLGGISVIFYQLFLLYVLLKYGQFVFSLTLVLLMLYAVAVTIIMYLEELPGKLRMYQTAQKKEDDFWVDKI